MVETPPPMPLPSGDQLRPFQRAMLLALTPPAVVNPPPAYTSPLFVTSMSSTQPSVPLPRADHALPFQRAMLFTGTPPAVVKYPPAYTSPLLATARAVTRVKSPPLMPLPRADHS